MISLDAEKAFDKIQHPFILKILERSGIQGPYLNIVKAKYSKPVAKMKLSGEKFEFHKSQGLDKAAHSFPTYTIKYLNS